MRGFLPFTSKIAKLSTSTIFCGLALFIITWATYVFGYMFLRSGSLLGNDSGLHLTYCRWIDQNWHGLFGPLPAWNSQQGVGVSLAYGYPIAFHKITVGLSRVSSFDLAQSFRLVTLSSFLLFAWGEFFFVWFLLKNKLAGLLASLMFLITPMAWGFVYIWGFIPYIVSFAFIPWYLLFLELMLTAFAHGKRWRGLWLVLCVLLLTLATITHAMTGISLMASTVILGVLYQNPFKKLGYYWRSLVGCFLLALSFLSVGAFWLAPFFRYSLLANRDGLNNVDFGMIPEFKWPYFFGYQIPVIEYNLRSLSLVWWVSLAALGGVVLWLFLKRARWSILAAVAVFFSWAPRFIWVLYRIPFVIFAFGPRTMIGVMLALVPLLAAGFLWDLPNLITLGFGKALKKFLSLFSRKLAIAVDFFKKPVSSVICLLAFIFLLVNFQHPQSLAGFSTYGLNIRQFSWDNVWPFYSDLCDGEKSSSIITCQPSIIKYFSPASLRVFCDDSQSHHLLCQKNVSLPTVEQAYSSCDGSFTDPGFCWARRTAFIEQLWPGNWPDFLVSRSGPGYQEEVAQLGRVLENDGVSRVSISPNIGQYTQMLGYSTNISHPDLYTFQISLNHYLWGYLQGALYTPGRAAGSEVSSLAWYWGLDEVLATADENEVYQLMDNPDFSIVKSASNRPDPFRLTYSNSPGIYTATNRPVWLVIGQFSRRSYETAFRLANQGVFPYQNMLLVEGSSAGYLDDYSLDELKPFSGLILHGYRYRNQTRAFQLLEEYLRQGGQVFLDTGWQYASADWNLENPPDWWPTGPLNWSAVSGDRWADPNLLVLEPLGGLASTGYTEYASWAAVDQLPADSKVLVSAGDKVLASERRVGNGLIVWSGSNMLSRAYDTIDSPREKDLLAGLFSLFGRSKVTDFSLEMSRPSADKVVFTASEDIPQGSFLYFREAYEPSWHSLDQKSGQELAKALPAGPDLQGYFLPSLRKGESFLIEYRLWWGIIAAKWFSLAGFFFLFLWALEQALGGKVTFWVTARSIKFLKHLGSSAKQSALGEETEHDRDAGVGGK